jgi:uncharacterized protein
MPSRAILLLFAALLALPLAWTGSGARADDTVVPLTISTKSGNYKFGVEVADTAEERSTGLMYRRDLPENRGMLFDFGAETEVSMWMRNTYIPLDMVFLRADGVVHRVQHDTVPFSEAIISAGAPVRYVVELAAGTAKKLGLARGDRVASMAIGN